MRRIVLNRRISKQLSPLDKIVRLMIPKSMKARQTKVFSLNCDKVDRRISSKSDHPDFLSHIIKSKEGVAMPIQELYANSTLIVLAGSESTASGLAGITFNLLRNPAAFDKAVAEIRSAFTSEQDIEPETVKRLPYLAAIVSEGLRMYPPFPEGLPRLTPRQGAVICGQWVPGGVSFFFFMHDSVMCQKDSANGWGGVIYARHMCSTAPTRLTGARSTLRILTSSPRSAGSAIPNSRLITKRLRSPFPSARAVASAGSKSSFLPLSFFLSLLCSPLSPSKIFFKYEKYHSTNQPKKFNSLAYLEMRLILARMLWSFDMTLSPECARWDEQESWIQWDKKPLMVGLSLVGK